MPISGSLGTSEGARKSGATALVIDGGLNPQLWDVCSQRLQRAMPFLNDDGEK